MFCLHSKALRTIAIPMVAFGATVAATSGYADPASDNAALQAKIEASWNGLYDSSFGPMHISISPQLSLLRAMAPSMPNIDFGNGAFAHNDGTFFIDYVDETTMRGTWFQSSSSKLCDGIRVDPFGNSLGGSQYYGRFVFDATPTGFTGHFGYCFDPPTSGEWNGTRKQDFAGTVTATRMMSPTATTSRASDSNPNPVSSKMSDQTKLATAKYIGPLIAAGQNGPPAAQSQNAVVTIGTFSTDFGLLTLDGNPVTSGSYAHHEGHVTIMGRSGNTMDGDWEEPSGSHKCVDGRYHGHFHWEFTQTGFTGRYGYCDDPANAGRWNGTRQ